MIASGVAAVPRSRSLDFQDEFDAIVVGGGCNGTGTARDLAMRGVRVLLVEKSTWGAGTTGSSSGMIHGGIRYLRFDREVTRKSCLDSGFIQHIAPHLLFRIPFILPILKSDPHPERTMLLAEVFFEAYDKFQPLKNGRPHTRLTRDELLDLEPGLTPDVVGGLTMDEWGIDATRLCVANALSAREHGAMVRNHTAVTEFILKGERIVGVRLEDTIDHRRGAAHARVVVNTAGPWAARLAGLVGAAAPVKMRPGKGVHVVFDRRLSDYAIIATAVDGRQVFLMPHENSSWIGTTDDDYFGDPDHLEVFDDEVAYLKGAIARVFPPVNTARMTHAFSGLRPTIFEAGKYEDELTRDHKIVDHELEGGPAGLVSMIGGKLAAYRLMSEELADTVAAKLGVSERSQTAEKPLPGGEAPVDVGAIAAARSIPLAAAGRVAYRHGARSARVIETIGNDAYARVIVCPCEAVLESEVRFVCREEGARTLCDVARHTRLGLGACQGARCATPAIEILADECALDAEAKMVAVEEFLRWRWGEMTPVLSGPQLAQAELWRWCTGGRGVGQ